MTQLSRFAPFRRARTLTRRALRDTGGTLSVELVLVLPMLTLWFAASFIFFDVFRVSYVNDKAAYTVADLISRQMTAIDADDIDGMNKIFDFLIDDRGLTWIRVSSVQYIKGDPSIGVDDQYLVEWSSATRGHQEFGPTGMTEYDLVKYIPIMGNLETVILTETFTRYIPPLEGFIPEQNMSTFIVTRPRFVPRILFTPSAPSS